MADSGTAAIDVAEHAYDMQSSPDVWLSNMLAAGLPLLDSGCGVVGVEYVRKEPDAIDVCSVCALTGPNSFAVHKDEMMATAPPGMVDALTQPGIVATMSEVVEGVDGGLAHWQRHFSWMQDALGVTALDPNGMGIVIVAGRPNVTRLPRQTRHRWRRLSVHVSAGHRIRRGLDGPNESQLPLNGEAVLDPRSFQVTEATRDAQPASARDRLRAAAKRIDRARGQLRRTDPDEALDIWLGLVNGRWSLVDWFDSDGRRFIVARPNPPEIPDPRALTRRERQVATYASFGESGRLIAYRLGIAPSTVSGLLASVMNKLGVATRAQLIDRLHNAVALGASDGREA